MTVKILCYHGVEDQIRFENQIKFVTKHYNPVTIYQIEDFFYKGTHLPERAMLISFDDGERSVLENALPILRKYNCPAALFIIATLIDSNESFWWDEARYYSDSLTDGNALIRQLKTMRNDERLAKLQILKMNSGKPPLRQHQLTIDELKYFEASDVAICNHTYSHPMLDQCTDDEITREFVGAKFFFERNQLAGYRFLAYPNGNVNSRVKAIAKQNGIRLAFLFNHKIAGITEDPLLLSRLSINDYTSIAKLRFIVSGWHSRVVGLSKLRKKIFS